jgi:chromosome segregation ATPase
VHATFIILAYADRMIAATRSFVLSLSLLVAASCGRHDNSADTDKTSEELRQAQTDVTAHSNDVAKNQDDIEQQKRALLRDQQDLADKQKLLEQQRQQLGSAQGTLVDARVAYAAAVKERLAKLDASVATLATKTDAKSKDASAGFRARRDQLSAKVGAMPTTADADWNQYTKDVDVTFDAIERDLNRALD